MLFRILLYMYVPYLWAAQLKYSDLITTEVCSREELDIRCKYNEVIAMTIAMYGHLHQGRCIPRDLGHFGCQADVLHFMDGKCSNKRMCTLSMTDSELVNLEPACAVGLITFLETAHICVEGQPILDFCRVLPVEQTTSFFLSFSAGQADCVRRQQQAYLSLAAKDGQKIKLVITDFNQGQNKSQAGERFVIEENGSRQEIELLLNGKGYMEVEYTSSTPRITLILADLEHNALISYQATGCLEFTSPQNTWTKRNSDILTVGCYHSDQTWNLTCIGTKWIGGIGNCTRVQVEKVQKEIPSISTGKEETTEIHPVSVLSKEIWIIIICVATLFACGLTFLIGCICVKMAKRKYSTNKSYERCEMVPLDANLRPIRNGDVKNENIRAWQQTLTSQSNNRSLARNNNGQLIVMDQDLITINGI